MRYIRKNKKFIIIFIIFVCILFIKEKCFAAFTPYDADVDIYDEVLNYEAQQQNNFVYFAMFPYFENTEAWQVVLYPILEEIHAEQYDIYIVGNRQTNNIVYTINLFRNNEGIESVEYTKYSAVSGSYVVKGVKFNSKTYTITYTPSTNNISSSYINNTVIIPNICTNYKSPLFIEFMQTIYGQGNINTLLNSISLSLDNIESLDSDIISALNTLSSTLNTISSNTSTNYSQQIGQISSKISDLLDDNQTIISQNEDMIEQQQQINENLEQVDDSVQELKDTITDSNIESGASDLPSTNVNDPTQNGIDNIFQSIYNAFCSGQAQDIVFPIPFTDKNITLSPYYVRDMLNNNNAGWVYTIIQAFWGYLIGRFIVYDVMKKITKIKSGNIEELETNNIKGEML